MINSLLSRFLAEDLAKKDLFKMKEMLLKQVRTMQADQGVR
jgi:hypothetical protein